MLKCNQCSNNAFYKIPSGACLCLDCYEKINRMNQDAITQLARYENYLLDSMDEMTGIPSYSRIKIPQQIVYKDNKMQNFINIDRSVIGTVNTGIIDSLNQSMNSINNQGEPELASLMSVFVTTLLKSQDINEQEKQEALEGLEFISEQIGLPDEEKKKSISKKIFYSLEKIINSSASLIAIWKAVEPYINKVFNNGNG